MPDAPLTDDAQRGPYTRWWLSFADPTLPKGQQFLGACIVRGTDVAEAAMDAHLRGCNPGGEVRGVAIPDGHRLPESEGVLLQVEDIEGAARWPA